LPMSDNNDTEKSQGADSAEAHSAQVLAKINAIDVSNSLSAPLKKAIDDILMVAGESVGSADASVLIRDGNEGGLRFLVAVSEIEDQLLKIRIPPGKGIAGLVFSSGQPMAVNDVSSEGSFWSGADKAIGFKTITLLATPLRTGNETIGVLEFVNRPGEPPYPPFTPEEMDRAAGFADTIAHLLNAYELAVLIESLFDRTVKSTAGGAESGQSGDEIREWLKGVEGAPEHRDLLLQVICLREIVERGQPEREMCRDLLETLARFTEKHSASSSSYFNF